MGPTQLTSRVLTWADDLDENTINQAANTAALPIVAGHVALMADAHLGYGCAIGSVVPTDGAIIPSAVGVDIGCGMSAVMTDLTSHDLPDDLAPYRDMIERRAPAKTARDHHTRNRRAADWLASNRPRTELSDRQNKTAYTQLGSAGGGNHFNELALDQEDRVWVVLHSGSRGIGNQLATGHIKLAATVERHAEGVQFDPDLAWFTEGTDEFDHYVTDLRFAQAYALENREIMLDESVNGLFELIGHGRVRDRVACHHNYAEVERHHGKDVWVTRKGAIRAGIGDRGINPGSMGTSTHIVAGKGNADSFNSASHGAGRRMSRNKARKTLSIDSLHEAMAGRAWLDTKAEALLDEHPAAYKDIAHVMDLQADLVEVTDTLEAIVNFKGA